jgi:hypothetical protein
MVWFGMRRFTKRLFVDEGAMVGATMVCISIMFWDAGFTDQTKQVQSPIVFPRGVE